MRKVNVKRFVKCPRSQKKTTVRNRGKHGQRTVVAELSINWLEQQWHKTTAQFPEPVPAPEKAYLFPAFSLNWFLTWGRITNGELVVTEAISSCRQKTTDFNVPEFKSHRHLPGKHIANGEKNY